MRVRWSGCLTLTLYFWRHHRRVSTTAPSIASSDKLPPNTLLVGGATLSLLPEKAVWVHEARALLIADLHLGKALSFRRLGVPVPRGTTATNLQRLSQLVARHQPQQVIFLGDFMHSAMAQAAEILDPLAAWRAAHPALSLTLVRGNHDSRAGDPPASFDIACVPEPLGLPATRLALCHHPQAVAGRYVVAGHLHPSITISSRFERLRCPCFHATDDALVVPAFGEFTGTHPVRRVLGDRVFVVAGGSVVPVTA
jgi:uncharacterized protein